LVLILVVHLYSLIPILLLNLILGAITAGVTIQLLTWLQQRVAHSFLGRSLATYAAFQAFAKVGGMAVVSATVAHLGVVWLLLFDGALYLLSSGLVWILLVEKDRR
jgi:hypothetical protein